MKRWAVVACTVALANCAEPQISVTDASPHEVGFLVRDPGLMPAEVDEQAAVHCRQYGLSYRRTDAAWISPAVQRFSYECVPTEHPPVHQARTRRPQPDTPRPPDTPPPAAAPQPAAPQPTASQPEDSKAAAWAKAKDATHTWARCLQRVASRKARETTEAPQLVAREVVAACTEQENAVHQPLIAIGEDSSGFQADMHAQAVQNAADAVSSVRTSAGAPVAEPAASRSDAPPPTLPQ